MFVFNRSAAAVLVPLALLLAAVLWTNRPNPGGAAGVPAMEARTQTAAVNLPSR